MYAYVIVDISSSAVDRPFQYRIPAELEDRIHVGSPVKFPFGNGRELRSGFVVGLTRKPALEESRIRDIAAVDSSKTTAGSQLVALAGWMKETYGSTMNQALRTVLPVREKVKPREKKRVRLLADEETLRRGIAEAEKKKHRARARILMALLDNPVIPMDMARNQLRVTEAQLKPLADRGILTVEAERVFRAPGLMASGVSSGAAGEKDAVKPGRAHTLNREQQAAVDEFTRAYDSGDLRTTLLFGVTGSGKTEVYMEMMDHVLSAGRQVILLIPEISLTWQTVLRFYRRFGDRIAVINSRLSAGERYDQWEKAERGEVSIMIGPRSALFAPFPNPGLIIIDEEHENSYRSELSPCYHAREAAEERARLAGAAVVLGSATPSLESYSRAEAGEYRLLRLTARATPGSVLPTAEIIDMRRELAEKNRSIFSRRLHALIEDRLARKEQIMLFINRRGAANFVSCRSCGEPIRCPHCDVTLKLHGRDRLVCHYCGYETRLPRACPFCGSPYLAGFGVGTEKLEAMTKREFPDARVLRMDADTTRGREGHQKILEAFAAGEADILVGTQMIVKGHDFGNVTLVGIMAADLTLNTPDYRAAERTFQLITQAAGRAGRTEKAGNVVIQSYEADHYAVRCAAAQDYETYYRQEMAYRKLAGYPPAVRLLTIRFSSKDEAALNACVNAIAEDLRAQDPEKYGVRMIGPAEAPVYRVNDVYRKILYFKADRCDILVKIRKYTARRAADPSYAKVLLQTGLE